jgi:hypothetical protein
MNGNKFSAALFDFLIGLAIGGHSMFPDLFNRIVHAWNGGTGQSADWGEPLFYLVIIGVPLGALGAGIGVVLTEWLGRKAER